MRTSEDKVYKILELVGSSELGIEEAINGAIGRATETVKKLEWFTVKDIRGSINENKVQCFQVILKVGFLIEDHNDFDDSTREGIEVSGVDSPTLDPTPPQPASTQNTG